VLIRDTRRVVDARPSTAPEKAASRTAEASDSAAPPGPPRPPAPPPTRHPARPRAAAAPFPRSRPLELVRERPHEALPASGPCRPWVRRGAPARRRGDPDPAVRPTTRARGGAPGLGRVLVLALPLSDAAWRVRQTPHRGAGGAEPHLRVSRRPGPPDRVTAEADGTRAIRSRRDPLAESPRPYRWRRRPRARPPPSPRRRERSLRLPPAARTRSSPRSASSRLRGPETLPPLA
jgi:hypothetical protein